MGMKVTVVTDEVSISKHFSLGVNNKLKKDKGGHLSKGLLHMEELDVTGLKDLIIGGNTSPKTVFICGTAEFDNAFVVTKDELKNKEHEDLRLPKISRSLDNFEYRGGEGFLFIDYDPNPNEDPLSKDELFKILYKCLPEIKDAPHLWKVSSSSNIYNGDDKLIGLNGQHIFVHIANTLDIERIIDVFYKRLWINGYGYTLVSANGGILSRTIIDKVVNKAGREIFIHAHCKHPLWQDMLVDVYNCDSLPLNTFDISDITVNEEGRYNQLVKESKDKIIDRANETRKIFVKKYSDRLGVTSSKLNDCIINNVLYGDNIITLFNGVQVTVADLFSDPDEYNGLYCCDPLEPDYGGSNRFTKAIINIYEGNIHSYAHGHIIYTLENSDRVKPLELALDVSSLDTSIMFKSSAKSCFDNNFSNVDIDIFINSLSGLINVNKGVLKKDFFFHYNKLIPESEKSNGFELYINGDMYDDYGKIKNDFVQDNFNIPINHQFVHTFMVGDKRHNKNTIENYEFMWRCYGIDFYYDVIKKSELVIKNEDSIVDHGSRSSEATLVQLETFCELNGLDSGKAKRYKMGICHKDNKNVLMDAFKSVKCDNISRLDLIIDSIELNDYDIYEDDELNSKFTDEYKRKALKLWFVQAIAALDWAENTPLKNPDSEFFNNNENALRSKTSFEYILVFVGSQGIGKTSFIRSLLPIEYEDYILTGHELNVDEKYNVLNAISHWITELGELGSTFKRSDIDAIKAFMSNHVDKLDLKYDKEISEFRRQTVFCGSVNDVHFLNDLTGNRRFLPINVKKIKPLYNIDVIENGKVVGNLGQYDQSLKLWAEILKLYMEGEQWWPRKEDEKLFELAVDGHARSNHAVDLFNEMFDSSWNDDRLKRDSRHSPDLVDITHGLKVVHFNRKQLMNGLGLDKMDFKLLIGDLANKGVLFKYQKDEYGIGRRCIRLVLRKGAVLGGGFVDNSFSVPGK